MKKITKIFWLIFFIATWAATNGGLIVALKLPPAKTIFFCWCFFTITGFLILLYGIKWSIENY